MDDKVKREDVISTLNSQDVRCEAHREELQNVMAYICDLEFEIQDYDNKFMAMEETIHKLQDKVAAALTEGIRIGFEGAREQIEPTPITLPNGMEAEVDNGDRFETVEELLKERTK